MGISWINFDRMREMHILTRRGQRILDIGSSNAYSAPASSVAHFVRYYNPEADNVDAFAEKMAYGSGFDPLTGGRNEAFAGEIFEAAGFEYDSVDVAQGYKTTVLDLNREALIDEFRSDFDLVLNFGTTEHILNQHNAFKAIHDATKPNGFMWHQVPTSGHVNHGYFCYTGRFFIELAQANNYKITDLWLDGPVGEENLSGAFRHFQQLIPGLDQIVARMDPDFFNNNPIPTAAITAIFQRQDSSAFRLPLETTTSVGIVPSTLLSSYRRSAKGDAGLGAFVDKIEEPTSQFLPFGPQEEEELIALTASLIKSAGNDPSFQARILAQLSQRLQIQT